MLSSRGGIRAIWQALADRSGPCHSPAFAARRPRTMCRGNALCS